MELNPTDALPQSQECLRIRLSDAGEIKYFTGILEALPMLINKFHARADNEYTYFEIYCNDARSYYVIGQLHGLWQHMKEPKI
jgi:hypothetical protein